ncbi:hypothetical protein [Shouchella clausii]|uniref:hypothetical protein n=1 Tax=Shouchella clausii TaxID=79880 RepID=UPI0031844BCF
MRDILVFFLNYESWVSLQQALSSLSSRQQLLTSNNFNTKYKPSLYPMEELLAL